MSLAGRDLTIGYSDRVVGRGLNVALERGEVLALLGPNGGGKTTLLKTLLGILAPRAGDVAIGGRTLAGISIRERARLIAYVPQVHVPTFAFTVDSVVLMGRTAHGNLFSRPSARDRTVATRVLEQFGIAHLAPRPYAPSGRSGKRDLRHNFNFIRDTVPVAGISHGPLIMEVNPTVPAKTVPEFIAYAKANPGKINFASPGNGAVIHLCGELFKMMTD